MFIIHFIFVIICFSSFLGIGAKEPRPKYIIDNDAGGDDSMSIFIGLLYEKYFNGPELIALTTGNGNTDEDNVCLNNQKILKIAGRQEVPIYRGSKSSLVITPESVCYYGVDGMGDNNDVYSDLKPPLEQNAIIALIELSKKYEGKLSVVTIGTLTNIALAIKHDPNFLNRLEQLYIGAGHIHSKEDPKPEFNAYMDVEAYHVVMQNANPDKVTVFPYSQTRAFCNYSREWRENILGAIDNKIVKAQNLHERVSLPKNERWMSLDPAVVSTFVNADLVQEFKYAKNDIIMCGDQRGINTNEYVNKHEANVRIVHSVKTEAYKKFLIDVLSAGA